MDQFYFESGYLEAGYFGTLAEAVATVTAQSSVSADVRIANKTGYFIEDYLADGYFVTGTIAEAAAAITAAFAAVAVAGKLVSAASSISATFTQTGTISHIEGADLFALSDAALAAAVNRIRDNNTAASSAFSVATDVTRVQQGDSDSNAIFTAIINGLRSRAFTMETQAAFSFAAALDGTILGAGAFTSAFTQTASLDGTKLGAGSFTVTSSVTATISHIEGADLVCNGFATLTCEASDLDLAAAALISSSTVLVTASRTRGITQNLSAVASVYARPKFGVTWIDANGQNVPNSGNNGTTGATIDNSVFKFGTGSLKLDSSFNLAGIVATTNANDLSIPAYNGSSTSNFSVSFWVKGSSGFTGVVYHLGNESVNLQISVANNSVSVDYTPTAGQTATYYTTGLTGMTITNWNFIEFAGTYESPGGGNRTPKIYVNGVGQSVVISNDTAYVQLETALTVGNLGAMLPSVATRIHWIDDFQYRIGNSAVIGSLPTAQAAGSGVSTTKTLLNLNGSFDDTVSVVTHSMSADMASRATVTADVSKFKFVFGEAVLASAASTSATVLKIKSSAVALASAFTQDTNTDLSRIRTTGSTQLSEFTQSTSAVKTADIVLDLNSQATFTGIISHIEGADLVAFSAAAVTTTGLRIRPGNSALDLAATQTTQAQKTVDAISNQSSSVSQTASVVVSRDLASNMASTTSLTAVNDRIRSFASSQASEFTQASTESRIRSFASAVTAQVTQTASALRTARISLALTGFASSLAAVVKIARADAISCDLFTDLTAITRVTYSASKALSVSATIVGTARKSVVTGSSIGAVSTVTAVIDNRTRSQTANLTTASTLAVEITKFSGPVLFVTSAFTQTANNIRSRPFDSALSSVATQTAQGRVTRTTTLALSSAATISCVISHIEGADIVANNFATLTADADAGKFANAALTTAFTQTATIKRTSDVISNQSSAVTFTAAIDNRTRSQSASLSTAVAVTCTISHIEGADLVAFSASAVTITITKITRTTITATSAANLTASATKFRAFNANLAVSTSLIANVSKFSGTAVTLQASSSFSSNAGRLAVASAAITSAMTFVVTAKEINLDSLSQVIYRIPAEVFSYTIQQEVWLRTIDEETRIYTVKEE